MKLPFISPLLPVAWGALAFACTGCTETVVYRDRRPAPVIVERSYPPPPPPLVEYRPAPPFRRAVWVPGHWRYNGYRYVWVRGHYRPV